MKTRLTFATALLASFVVTEPAARADSTATVVEQAGDPETERSLAVGVAGSRGASGLELSYRQGRLQLVVGAMAARSTLRITDDLDTYEFETTFGLAAAAAFYRLADSDRTRLWFGMRGTAFFADDGAGFELIGGALDIPVRAELFLADRFSIHLEAGIRLSKTDYQGWENSSVSIGGGELLGNAGFAYHF